MKACSCVHPMLAQMQAQRLCPSASFAGSYACFHRSAPTQPLHVSSSRQLSESQLRQKFCSASISRGHQSLIVYAQSSNGAVARPWADKNARLVLEDGSVWEGRAFGAEGTAIAETVFNTSLTGYQEILTDPSYKGQYVVFTHPHIGNVGINFGEQAQLLLVATQCRPPHIFSIFGYSMGVLMLRIPRGLSVILSPHDKLANRLHGKLGTFAPFYTEI